MSENLPGHTEYERAMGEPEAPRPEAPKPADDAQQGTD